MLKFLIRLRRYNDLMNVSYQLIKAQNEGQKQSISLAEFTHDSIRDIKYTFLSVIVNSDHEDNLSVWISISFSVQVFVFIYFLCTYVYQSIDPFTYLSISLSTSVSLPFLFFFSLFFSLLFSSFLSTSSSPSCFSTNSYFREKRKLKLKDKEKNENDTQPHDIDSDRVFSPVLQWEAHCVLFCYMAFSPNYKFAFTGRFWVALSKGRIFRKVYLCMDVCEPFPIFLFLRFVGRYFT